MCPALSVLYPDVRSDTRHHSTCALSVLYPDVRRDTRHHFTCALLCLCCFLTSEAILHTILLVPCLTVCVVSLRYQLSHTIHHSTCALSVLFPDVSSNTRHLSTCALSVLYPDVRNNIRHRSMCALLCPCCFRQRRRTPKSHHGDLVLC